jgi:hypothetical protein
VFKTAHPRRERAAGAVTRSNVCQGIPAADAVSRAVGCDRKIGGLSGSGGNGPAAATAASLRVFNASNSSHARQPQTFSWCSDGPDRSCKYVTRPVQNSIACETHTEPGIDGMFTVAGDPQYAHHVMAER